MRKLMCFVLLAGWLAIGSTALADQFTITKVGNIRSGPGINYPVVGSTIVYQQWEILETQDNWIRIGPREYIFKTLGKIIEENKSLDILEVKAVYKEHKSESKELIVKEDENQIIENKEKEGELLMFFNQLYDNLILLTIVLIFLFYFIYKIIIERYKYNKRTPKKGTKTLVHEHEIKEKELTHQYNLDVAEAKNKLQIALDQKNQWKESYNYMLIKLQEAYNDMVIRWQNMYKSSEASHGKTREENIKILQKVANLVEAIGHEPLIQKIIKTDKKGNKEEIIELKDKDRIG